MFPLMQKRGGGSIIITSSVAGVRGSEMLAPYVTSKHAVVGLMRSAAAAGAQHQIRVNSVHPSPTETRMMRSLEEGIMPAKLSLLMKPSLPVFRLGAMATRWISPI